MRTRASEVETSTKKNPFVPSPDDSRWLTEVISGKRQAYWPGPKNPDPLSAAVNPVVWQNERTEMVLDALENGQGDWNKSIRYLENRVKSNETDIAARNALQYLEGFYGYHQFIENKNE